MLGGKNSNYNNNYKGGKNYHNDGNNNQRQQQNGRAVHVHNFTKIGNLRMMIKLQKYKTSKITNLRMEESFFLFTNTCFNALF